MQPTAIPFLSTPAFLAPAVLAPSTTAGPAGSEPSAPFGDLLKNAVTGIDGLEQQASSAVEGVLRGTGVDVHDAMIATQKADMSFELALAVRNKAVAAYQQVMGMQF
jgi:flagellar hook-basal body complex protein FliE